MSVPTIHSEEHGDLYLGKQPARPLDTAHGLWAELRKPLIAAGTLPKVPSGTFGHGNDFVDWLMLGNGPDDTVFPAFQGCGDCAWAGPAHSEMGAAKSAGRPVPPFSGKTVVAQYSAYSGYDPQTGENDNGSDPQAVLQWRQEKGLYDDNGGVYKIGPTVAADPGNLTHLWEIAYLLEDAGIGINVQQAQEDQFNEAKPVWNYVPGSQIVGAHWIEVMGRYHLITWARNIGFTDKFYEELNDETFGWIDLLRYNAVTGEDAEHHTDVDLEKYLQLIAAQKAG